MALPLLLSACQQLSLDNPKAPDTAGLEKIYDSPQGLLDESDLEEVGAAVAEQNALLESTDSLSLVEGLFHDVGDNNEVIEGGDQIDPTDGARLLAVARVTHICRGPEGDDVIDAERFGTITMTAKGSPRGLLPIAWGRFNTCVDHTALGEIELDGDYALTARREAGGVGVLFQFEGTIRAGDLEFEGSLDFRIRGDRTTELRFETPDGDVVVAVKRDGELVVRDREEQWECDFEALRCTETSSGKVLGAGGGA